MERYSVLSKSYELLNLVNINNPDMILVFETSLKPKYSFKISNYQCYRTDLLLLKIPIKQKNSEFLENAKQITYSDNYKLTLTTTTSVYNSSSKCLMAIILNLIFQKSKRKIIIGFDLDAKYRSWNSRTPRGAILPAHSTKYTHKVLDATKPTRFGVSGPDILDIFIFNNTNLTFDITTIPALSFDHNLVFFEIQNWQNIFETCRHPKHPGPNSTFSLTTSSHLFQLSKVDNNSTKKLITSNQIFSQTQRAISSLPSFAKLTERIILTRLTDEIQSADILPNE